MSKKKKPKKDEKLTEKQLSQLEIDTMIDELEDWCRQATLFHLNNVKQHTGEIIVEDVDYCLQLSKRMVKYRKLNN